MARLTALALLAVLAAPAAGWLVSAEAGAACAMSCHSESEGSPSCCRLSGSSPTPARLGCSGADPGALSPSPRLGLVAASFRVFRPAAGNRFDAPTDPALSPGFSRIPDHVPLGSF